MAEEKPAETDKVKSVKIPVHYLGAGGLVAALTMLTPVKNFFYTRDEAVLDKVAITARVDKMERVQDQFRSEIISVLDKNTDRIMANINEKDQRNISRVDNLEKNLNNRIDLLMNKEIQNPSRRKNE